MLLHSVQKTGKYYTHKIFAFQVNFEEGTWENLKDVCMTELEEWERNMDALQKKDANLASSYTPWDYCMVGIIIGKNMDESGRDLIEVISHNFLGGSEENNENAVWLPGFPVYFRTGYPVAFSKLPR
jgi:hypothetical protein